MLEEHMWLLRKLARSVVIRDAMVDVDDLMQVGMLAALRAVESFEPAAGRSLLNWIGLLAKRAMWREANRGLPGNSTDPASLAVPTEDPTRSIDITRAIERLDSRRQAVVTLALAGCHGAEIGDVLGVSRERVRQLVNDIAEKVAA